jgi:predicted metalloprotease
VRHIDGGRRPWWARVPVWLAAAVAVALGCAIGVPGSGGGTQPDSGSADQIVRGALTDVERYWSTEFPKLSHGKAFKPVQGGYHPYTRTDPPPACGSERPEYQPNAFYCPQGDFIAWDSETLLPKLNNNFGPLLVGVVIAHEYGHAIQVRLGTADQPTIVLEQQADCFAGSWVRDVNAGHAKGFDKPSPDQLDNTVAGLLQLRDQPGTPAVAEQAHGNAFDRIRALQDGFEQGATRCATYQADTIPVTEIPFTSREDAANGGDLPYNDAVNLLGQDAQQYWARTFPRLAGRSWDQLRVLPYDPARAPSCGGKARSAKDATNAAYYCAADGYIAFDNHQLGPDLYRNIGDNAIGMLLGDLFAQAVQERRGKPTQGREGQLAIDCLAGSWTYDLLHRGADSNLRLSPGDLDEAVAALLAFGRAAKSTEATAFDRISAFRNSVLNGLSTCE